MRENRGLEDTVAKEERKGFRRGVLVPVLAAALIAGCNLSGGSGPSPNPEPVKESELTSYSLDKSIYTAGETATGTAIGCSKNGGTVVIDLDGDGPSPPKNIAVLAGDFKVTHSGTMAQGSWIPWAELHPEGLRKKASAVAVNPVGSDPAPSFDLKYEARNGATNITDTLFNGNRFFAYFMGSDNDPLKKQQVWNPVTSQWEDLFDGKVINYGNGDTGTVFKNIAFGDEYFMIVALNSTGSNRTFDIKGRVIDQSDQVAQDTMTVDVLERIVQMHFTGSYTPITGGISVEHNMDTAAEITAVNDSQEDYDQVEWEMIDESMGSSFFYGESLPVNVNWVNSPSSYNVLKMRLKKGGLQVGSTITNIVKALDTKPNTPITYEYSGGGWIQNSDNIINVTEGVPLQYRVRINDINNDVLELKRIIDNEWGTTQMTSDEFVPNQGDIWIKQNPDNDGSLDLYEIRMNTDSKYRSVTPYTMQDYSKELDFGSNNLESTKVSTQIYVQP